MSVKIRQRFCVTDGIGVEDGQRPVRERERKNQQRRATVTRKGFPKNTSGGGGVMVAVVGG
jgi:hypothetical protein